MHTPDVALVDLQMPDLDGFAATREIGKAAPSVAVLILTMHEDDDSVFAAMRAGARGYLVKGASQEEILGGITAVARGEAIFGPGVAQRVLAFFRAGPSVAEPAFPELTPREREILDLLAAGLPNAVIGERLSLAPEDGRQQRVVDLRQAAGGGRPEAIVPRGRARTQRATTPASR